MIEADTRTIVGLTLDNGEQLVLRKNQHLWEAEPNDQTPGPFHVIDVSKWQAANAGPAGYSLTGVDGIYVRASYGTTSDPRYVEHAQYALASGVRFRGAYHFFRVSQSVDEQYATFREVVRSGPRMTLAPALDLEWGVAEADKDYGSKFSAGAHRLARWMREDFGGCLIYTAPYFWRDTLGSPGWVKQYHTWLSHYGPQPGEPADLGLPGPDTFELWLGHQYQGSPLDRNYFRGLLLAHGAFA